MLSPPPPPPLFTQDPLFQIGRFLFQGKNRLSCQITAIATPAELTKILAAYRN